MIPPPRQVLIISLGGAGDGLMATPLLRELHARWPDTAIDVVVMQGEAARDVFAGNPAVRECLLHNFQREPVRRSFAFGLALRRRRYDVSFTVMPQNRLEYNVVTRLIGARRRLGFDFAIRCGAMGRWLLTDRIAEDTQAHLVDNNLRLLTEGLGWGGLAAPARLDLFLTDEQRDGAERALQQQGWAGMRVIGLHPGTGVTKNLERRRWDPAKWAELACRLAADPRVRLMLFGSPAEAPLRADIRHRAGLPETVLRDAPAGSIRDAAALLARLDCLVCCDTLLTHLGAAVGTPQVVIMGPTPHTSVYPYASPHRIVRLDFACSPCYGYSRHGIRCTHPRPFACLGDITADQVASAVMSLRAEVARSGQPPASA